MRLVLACTFLLGALAAATARADLKVYDVDVKYRKEVFSALEGVLRPQSELAKGRIELLPTGQILIDTSAEMHSQIAAVLTAIEARQVEATPRVTLRYWAVLGTRAATDEPDDTPAILSEVLDELRRVHGDLSFRLLGNATLVTESGQSGSINGKPLSVNQQAFVEGTTLTAQLGIRFEYTVQTGQVPARGDGEVAVSTAPFGTYATELQGVELNTSMDQNEFVVVGENTVNENRVGPALSGTIFYIVYWPVAD